MALYAYAALVYMTIITVPLIVIAFALGCISYEVEQGQSRWKKKIAAIMKIAVFSIIAFSGWYLLIVGDNKYLSLGGRPWLPPYSDGDLKVKVLIPEGIRKSKDCRELYLWQEKYLPKEVGRGNCTWEEMQPERRIFIVGMWLVVPRQELHSFTGDSSALNGSSSMFIAHYIYPEMRSRQSYKDDDDEIVATFGAINNVLPEWKMHKEDAQEEKTRMKFIGDDYIYYCEDKDLFPNNDIYTKYMCAAIVREKEFYITYFFKSHLANYHEEIKQKLLDKLETYKKAGDKLWRN